jgi:hypothetical protein
MPLAHRVFMLATTRHCAPRRIQRFLAVSLVATILLCGVAGSSSRRNLTLPELVELADVICVGKVGPVRSVHQVKVKTAYIDDAGKELYALVQQKVAKFESEEILKGNATPGSCSVSFFGNPDPSSGIPPVFTNLVEGERVLIFLRRTTKNDAFDLFQPDAFPSTKLQLGQARPKTAENQTTLQKIILYLAAGTEQREAIICRECLSRLHEVGPLMYIAYSLEERPTYLASRIRKDIGEVGLDLEVLIRSDVMPVLARVGNDADKDTRRAALLAAGSLQSSDVLPRLLDIARDDAELLPAVIAILANYRSPSALQPLVGLLAHDTAAVRQSVAASLEKLGNPIALPFLLDRLGDGDFAVRYQVVSALHGITGQPGLPSTDLFKNSEREYLDYWRKWGVERRRVLEMNRSRLK